MPWIESLHQISIKPSPDFGRLETALRRGTPDRVPFYELFLNAPVMEGALGKPMAGLEETVEFYHRLGYDYVPTWVGIPLAGGDLVDTSKGYPIRDWQTFEAVSWPRTDDIDYSNFEATSPLLPDGMKMIGQTGGVFEMMESLCGYAGLCELLCTDRELVRAVANRVGELWLAAYRNMAAIEGVGSVVVSDDLGFKTQTLVAPDDLREFILPWHKKQVEAIHAAGKPAILHSCGNLEEIMNDLIDDVGIDAKHSYEDEIVPVTEMKRRYGGRIALLGGFDVDRLCRVDEVEIRRHTAHIIEVCAKGGGYAFGSGNSITGYVPLRNYLTMMDQAWISGGGAV